MNDYELNTATTCVFVMITDCEVFPLTFQCVTFFVCDLTGGVTDFCVFYCDSGCVVYLIYIGTLNLVYIIW